MGPRQYTANIISQNTRVKIVWGGADRNTEKEHLSSGEGRAYVKASINPRRCIKQGIQVLYRVILTYSTCFVRLPVGVNKSSLI